MSDEKQEESGVKIVDKRRFSAEGKSTGVEAESKDRRRELEETQSAAQSSDSAAAQSADSQPAAESAGGAEQHSEPEVDFASFVMSLAAQALMLMGEVPNPETGQLTEHLPAAKQTIEILDMLGQKTRGNLSKEEEKLLAELLTSLRMAYVNKVKNK